jgi:hypothetical protein
VAALSQSYCAAHHKTAGRPGFKGVEAVIAVQQEKFLIDAQFSA